MSGNVDPCQECGSMPDESCGIYLGGECARGPRVVRGEAHIILSAPPTEPYWSLLLPHEQKAPSHLHPRRLYHWRRLHERIFNLEKELGFHEKVTYDVLPWMHAPSYDY